MSEEQKTPDPETMPLADLKALALAEAAKAAETATTTTEDPADKQEKTEQPRTADGRFTKAGDGDDIELPAEDVDETEEAKSKTPVVEEEDEPQEFIYERSIDLGDGSGKQVFRGKGKTREEALEALTDKLAEAQTHASKKIHDLNQKVKVQDTRTAQEKQDDEYVIQERLKKEPKKTIKEVINEVIREREEATERSLVVQKNFVATHPDYEASESNGTAIRDWVQNSGATEFTEDNLEKAYQALKKSGLLKLKAEGADADTATKGADQKRIASPTTEVTQQRSQKKGSTISTTSRTAPKVNLEPSEDELYSMPMDKLRDLSNKHGFQKAGE